MSFDPLAQDPPVGTDDGGPRATMVSVGFRSGGAILHGIVYVPGGAGPHPAVLILHGLPGYERNLDMAQAYRRAGWASMVFHYRGSWGSEGDYTFEHVLEDVRAALAFLRSDEGVATCRVAAERIAVAGHSTGGWAALMTAAADPTILGVASLAGYNLGMVAHMIEHDPPAAAATEAMIATLLAPLRGTSAAALVAEVLAHGADWDACGLGPTLAGRPVLVVGGERDEDVAPSVHHEPLVAALSDGRVRLTHWMLDADHAFSNRRVELTRRTLDWLTGLLAAT